MRRRVAPVLISLLLTAATSACGDDESLDAVDRGGRDGGGDAVDASGGTGGSRAGSGGRPAAGSGGGRAGTGGRGSESSRSEVPVSCGEATCEPSPDPFTFACCADEATSTCGVSVFGGRCAAPPGEFEGCPTLDFAGILSFPSCCNSQGMCGIDTSSVGGPRCIDLATAAERARTSGATVVFPAPRACSDPEPGERDAGVDGGPIDDLDAGRDDDAGA